jgi:hypothetical protein
MDVMDCQSVVLADLANTLGIFDPAANSNKLISSDLPTVLGTVQAASNQPAMLGITDVNVLSAVMNQSVSMASMYDSLATIMLATSVMDNMMQVGL